MAKRKITVTVDEDLVESARTLGETSLSALVNRALASELDQRARAAALARLLADWDDAFGPVGADDAAAAIEAFDDLDATDVPSSTEVIAR